MVKLALITAISLFSWGSYCDSTHGWRGVEGSAFKNHLHHREPSLVSLDVGPRKPKSIDFSRLSRHMPGENATDDASVWYVLATAGLLGYHQEAKLGDLWKYIAAQDIGGVYEQVSYARRIRETTLKASTLVGFPRAINGLTTLKEAIKTATPRVHDIVTADQSLRAPLSPEFKLKRGKKFFRDLYAENTDLILKNMAGTSGGDLDYFAVASIYGELLGEMSIVKPLETVMLEFVCCLVDDAAPQANGHFLGCRNLGATRKQVDAIIALVGDMAEQLGKPPVAQGKGYEFLKETW